jgi:chromosome segregation ATPase
MADLYGGSPADVKMPNRRTARGAGTTPTRTSELVDVRNQLAALQQEATGADGTTRRGGGAAGRPEDLEDEVTTLYHELQRAAGKLEMEKAQRKKAEAELESIRQHRLRETADVVQELEKKRIELNSLREERAMMKEWLDRGVAECRRVAEEVVELKLELESSDRVNADLTKERQRLAVKIQEMSDELSAVQLALDRAQHEKATLELKADESGAIMARAEEERKAAMSECDRLSAEVTRLSQRVRGLEDAELSMQSMIACLAELVREVGDTELCVTTGNLDAPRLSEGIAAAAAANIAEPRPLSSMLVDSKRRLQELQDCVSRLRASVKRFVASKQKAHQDMANAHRAALDMCQREHDATAAAHRAEVDQLQRRIVDLEREIIRVADGVERDTHQEAQQRMQQLDGYATTNRDLQKELDVLKFDNDKLRAKAKKMKLDWSKVDDSRRRFQQLQMEVNMMRDSYEKLQMENKNLRLMLEGGGFGTSRGAHSPAERDRSVHLHRQAFEDWRHTKMGYGEATGFSPQPEPAFAAHMAPSSRVGTGFSPLPY